MEDNNSKEVNGGGEVGVRRSFASGLRLVALVATVTATVVMGVAKQTEIVPVKVFPDLPPVNVPAPAKWQYMSAFVFFVVSNIIACSYATLSLLMVSIAKKGRTTLIILTADLLMVALLCSCNGAAGAVGIIGYNGNSHVNWNKVCNIFDKFCQHIAASVVISLIGALAFFSLVLLAALPTYRKSV